MADIGTAPARGALDSDALSELREGFRGDVIEPGDARYDETRQVFNGMFDRRPAAILRPTGTADVIRAIGLARLTGLPFAIRSGGHSVAGFSSCDGGIVLDLRALKGIRIDPERRTVRVQGGVDWGELDRETQQFGLAVTGGRVTSTGVIGFTTGSGSGWLERKLGFACDSLISADVVTADGDVVVATEHENSDLLWALKGGGGNFGVITEAEFRLHPRRADRLRRADGVRPRAGTRGDLDLARHLEQRARGARLGGRLGDRAARAVRPGRMAGTPRLGRRRAVRRPERRGGEADGARSARSARSSTSSSRCRTRWCKR